MSILFRRTLNLVNSIESKEESINPITTNDEEYTMSSITLVDENTRTILHTRIINLISNMYLTSSNIQAYESH